MTTRLDRITDLNAFESDLPDFDAPPVVETLLGVELAPLRGWDIRHFGLLWERLREEYPQFAVQPALPRREVSSLESAVAKNFIISVLGADRPPIRAWFVDSSKTRLLQVQDDRFIHNWRKVVGDEKYPHYDESVRPEFVRSWERLLAFLSEFNLGPPEIERWEVTYVNHLERGREWHKPSDIPRLFPTVHRPTGGTFLPAPDATWWKSRYLIPNDGGELSISVQPAVRNRDKKEVLQVTLQATGDTPASSLDSVLECFDRGRAWIVNGFTDITSPELHDLWQRKSRR